MQRIAAPIDWHYWQHMQEVEFWQACLLSLNINPDAMKFESNGWMSGPQDAPYFENKSFPSDQACDDYRKRLNLLKSNKYSPEHFTAGKLNMGSPNRCGVLLPEFAAWASHIKISIPPELEAIARSPEMLRPEAATADEQQQGTRWPNHETTKLAALRMAAVRFWKNYDPNDRSTAPKNSEVIEWLKMEQNIPSSVAESMASILRPDDLKPGPRG